MLHLFTAIYTFFLRKLYVLTHCLRKGRFCATSHTKNFIEVKHMMKD